MKLLITFSLLLSLEVFPSIREVPFKELQTYNIDCPVDAIKTGSYGGQSKQGYKKRCQVKNLVWFDGYISYVINQNRLVGMAKKFPQKAKLIDFGKTVRGKKMLALKVTDYRFPDEKMKTPVLLNCAHHASELMSTEFCYQLLSELLHTDSDVISKYVFYVVPLVNPDGSENYWHRTRASGRKNGRRTLPGNWTGKNGVDLNRNYPFKWGQTSNTTSAKPNSVYYMGKGPGSEPEIQAMMDLANEKRFALSLSFHTAATKVLIPYTIPGAVNPNPDVPRGFADILALKAKTMRKGRKYKVAKNLYPVSGTDQDWHYNENGTIALLVEGPFFHRSITYKKSREVVKGILPGFYFFLRHFEKGPKIRVFVKDRSGNPVVATVSLREFDTYENENWKTDSKYGRYIFTLTKKGKYHLEVNYNEKTLTKEIVVGEGFSEINITI